MSLHLTPVTFREAKAFLAAHHRHHPRSSGWKFGIGVADDEGQLRGVVIVGKPVARMLDDNTTAEVTRLCTDGTPNACSMLYGAAWRAAKAMGYRRLITYTTVDEPGTSLRAAGWKALYETRARSWNMPGRPREDKHVIAQRRLWEVAA